MSHEYSSILLDEPIENLKFSEEFRKCCSVMGYHTLNEVIEASPEGTFRSERFDYNWLGELVEFLTERQLIYLLQPLPGKPAK